MSDDKKPQLDPAEHKAYFPSPFSLGQFTAPKSDLSGADYDVYRGGRWKVLVIATDERYLPMDNGTFFSTGNHPVETLLPLYHMAKAGFDIEIATLSGNPVKLELWAMPSEDEVVLGFYESLLPQLRAPRRLSDIVATLDAGSPYLGLFIPGGHGALIGLPESRDVQATLVWAMLNNRHVISLCHGPAAFLAAGLDGTGAENIFHGYRICAFPDAVDRQTPDIGYMPGHLTWFFGARLEAMGLQIINKGVTGETVKDRTLITGDSPAAANAVGKLAARALLEAARG